MWYYVREFLQLCFDEAQKMFLVHAAGVMHVGVNFSNVVEITMRHALLMKVSQYGKLGECVMRNHLRVSKLLVLIK
jgi:hypothetical protein